MQQWSCHLFAHAYISSFFYWMTDIPYPPKMCTPPTLILWYMAVMAHYRLDSRAIGSKKGVAFLVKSLIFAKRHNTQFTKVVERYQWSEDLDGMSHRSLSGHWDLKVITHWCQSSSDHDEIEMNNIAISIALNRGREQLKLTHPPAPSMAHCWLDSRAIGGKKCVAFIVKPSIFAKGKNIQSNKVVER